MTDAVFPIGKHKGHPVEMVLDTDPQYAAWIAQQSWFAEGHPDIYQIIINNGQEPSETPDHNALQAKFLDPVFCRKFAETLNGLHMQENFKSKVNFEEWGADVALDVSSTYADGKETTYGFWLVEVKTSLGDDYPAVLRKMKRLGDLRTDQWKRTTYVLGRYKPVLMYRDFAASGVTLEQVSQIFEASGISVTSFGEVESYVFSEDPEII